MKQALLDAVEARRGCKEPFATVTDTTTGAQGLVDATVCEGGLALSDVQLSEIRRRVSADQSGVMDDGLFVRVYSPPARMVIVGAVHIAQALAPMAKLAGFDVTIIDPREAFVRSGQLADIHAIIEWPDDGMAQVKPDSRTAVVTLTHDPKLDDPALAAALRSQAFYIGALGSRKTHAKRLERLTVSIMAQVIETLRAEAA